MSDSRELTDLLQAWREGQAGAFDAIVPLIYADLRSIARRHLRQLGRMTFDTTGLVHEAYLKLGGQQRLDARDRAHFLAICARAMRQLVMNHVRDRMAQKRGAGAQVLGLDELELGQPSQAEELVFLDQALTRLGEIDEVLLRVFECRYFAGMTEEETALALDRPLRTVQRDWMQARAWIRELSGSEG